MTCANDIAHCITQMLEQYFRDLDGEKPAAVYDMMMRTVERPLLEYVLQQTHGNQSAAAQILGINRNTLRRKLSEHQLL